jgi:hypothetical protein
VEREDPAEREPVAFDAHRLIASLLTFRSTPAAPPFFSAASFFPSAPPRFARPGPSRHSTAHAPFPSYAPARSRTRAPGASVIDSPRVRASSSTVPPRFVS